MLRHPWLRDLVSAVIGLWIVVGIFIDGWAHVHGYVDNTFFTPWHANFYGGLVVFMIWLGVVALSVRRKGDRPQTVLKRLPEGYRGGVLGAVIFAVGGALDMLWHTVYGFEPSIQALLSPPHLVLLSGVLLMATTGWRSQRRLSPGATLPEIVSLTSVVAISGFFLNFLSPFRFAIPLSQYQVRNEVAVVEWVGALLVTTVLFVVPTLWQVRDGRYRFGTLTAFVAAVGLGVSIAMSDGWPLGWLLRGVAGAVLGALLAEALLASPRWKGWRYGLPLVMGVVPFLIWTFQLVGYATVKPIQWPVTLWGGALLFTAGAGAALGGTLWAGARSAVDQAPAQSITPDRVGV